MAANKPKRLSKVARELNVGLSTIADFLSEQGYDIKVTPNTRIDEEIHGLLVSQFQSEKSLKEESKISVKDQESEEKETVSLERSKEKEEAEEGEQLFTTKEKGSEEEEGEKAPPSTEEKSEEEEAGSSSDQVNVVGKVDLSSINQKTKPTPRKKQEAEAADKEAAPTEDETPEQEAVDPGTSEESTKTESEASSAEEKSSDQGTKEEESQEQQNTEKEQLSGPTVVGKINLPSEKKGNDPVASSSEKGDNLHQKRKKRKRKRIRKVDVDSAEPSKSQEKEQEKKKKGSKKKGKKEKEISEEDIQKEIKETLSKLGGGKKSKAAKLRRAKRQAISEKEEEKRKQEEAEKKKLKLTEFVTVAELASMMDTSANEVISSLMSLGIFASINQRLDAETLSLIAEEYGYEVEFISAEVQEAIQEEEDDPEELESRPPIVTVMGHVDHGKTSLLDYIREENVIAGEAGGITQHIGAYNVTLNSGKQISFIDTPGHEAFTAMRSRGAQLTDVAIIVIAADDNVMPQTKEAINHAQAAGVPMVFAINKVDKPDSDPERVKEQLAKENILVEEWGGKYQCEEISAKQGQKVDDLLEKVLLEAEFMKIQANPNKYANGVVIEASLDKGRGYVCTVLVQNGTLKIGDILLAGIYSGRVKNLYNERGQEVKEAGPSDPVEVLGLNGAPSAGDQFNVLEDEREAKEIAIKREQLQREQGVRTQKQITLDEIGRRLAIGDFQELNLVVKADAQGSVEALSDELLKLATEKIQINIIHKGVGQISESDILLAAASNAIIVGFQVRPSAHSRKLADKQKVDVRLYSVVYEAVEEIRAAMEGMLSPEIKEKIKGTAEIKDTFNVKKVGTVAGCYVNDGKIARNSKVRVIRDGIVVHTGELGSLKRFKDDVKEVSSGYECGLNIANFNDIKPGDQIEAFEEVEVKQTL